MSLLELPPEIWRQLFNCMLVSDILKLEVTCRKLYALTDLYWRTVTELNLVPFLKKHGRIDVSNAYRFDAASSGLIKRVGRYLYTLDISKFGPLEYGLRIGLEGSIVTHCRQLERLMVDNRLLDRQWLLQLSAATRRSLIHVSLGHVYIRHCNGLDDSILGELLQNWNQLETIRLHGNSRMMLTSWRHFPTSLRTLDIQGCSQSYVRELPYLLERCAALDSLSLTYSPQFGYFVSSERLCSVRHLAINTDTTILTVCPKFTDVIGSLANIRHLCLSTTLLSDRLFALLAETAVNLNHIELIGAQRCHLLTSIDEALFKLARIESLNRMTVQCNTQIGRCLMLTLYRMPYMHHVDVSYSVKERDLVDLWDFIQSPYLESLTMFGYVPSCRSKKLVTLDVLDKLKLNCPRLRILRL